MFYEVFNRAVISTFYRKLTQKTEIIEKNNNANEKTITQYKVFWNYIAGGASFPSEDTREFKEQLQQLNKETNIVVINQYIPSWQRESKIETKYRNWIERDLRPFMMQENITWIDLSSSIPDSEYGDYAHLFKQGRMNYTELFDKEIQNVIKNITHVN